MDYLPKGNEDAVNDLPYLVYDRGPKWTICRKAMKTRRLGFVLAVLLWSEMDYLPKGNEDPALVSVLSDWRQQSEMDYLPKGNEDLSLPLAAQP